MKRLTLTLCAALAFWALSASSGAQDVPSLREIVTGSEYRLFSISPSGEFMANIYYEDGSQLQFRDTKTLEVTQVVELGRFVPYRLEWTDDRRVILGGRSGLYSVSKNGSEVRPVLVGKGEDDDRRFANSRFQRKLDRWFVLGVVQDNRDEVIIQSYDDKGFASIHWLNLFSGEVQDKVIGRDHDVKQWFVAADGEPVVGMQEKGRERVHVVRLPESNDYVEHDRHFADNGVRLDYRVGGRYQRTHAHFASGDGSKLILTRLADSGRYELVRYDLASGTIEDTVISDERYDVGTNTSWTSALFNGVPPTLGMVSYLRAERHTVALDDRIRAGLDAIDTQLPATNNQLRGISPDGLQLVVFAASAITRGNWYHYDQNNDSLRALSEPRLSTDTSLLPWFRAIEVPMPDGYVLDGYLWLPDPSQGASRGLIVASQNRLSSRVQGGYDADLLYLASRGFAVLEVNTRGRGGYGREHMMAGLRDGMQKMTDDLASAAEWAREKGMAGNDNVFLFGWANGGTLALLTAQRYPDLFRAISTYGAPLDMVLQHKAYRKDDNDEATAYLDDAMADPNRAASSLKAFSPYHLREQLKTPLHLFHGSEDKTVAAKQAERFYEEAQEDGQVVEYREVSGGTQSIRSITSRELFLDRTLAFFETHMRQ